jgi:hypothetical protein
MNEIDPSSSSSSSSLNNNRFHLTPLEKEKYFGIEGEDNFNERFKYLAINNHKVNNSINNTNTTEKKERRERERNIVSNVHINIQTNESNNKSLSPKKTLKKKKEFLMSPLIPLSISPTRLREEVKNSKLNSFSPTIHEDKPMDNISSFLTEGPLVEEDEQKQDGIDDNNSFESDYNSIDSGDDTMLADAKVNKKLKSKRKKSKQELDDELSLQISMQEEEDYEDLQLITDQLSIIGDEIKDGGILRGITTENKSIKARLVIIYIS